MKANAPKRKVFQDAVDLLTGGESAAVSGNDIWMLPIENIRPFHSHPFHLYTGDRLDDMVEISESMESLFRLSCRKRQMDMKCCPGIIG